MALPTPLQAFRGAPKPTTANAEPQILTGETMSGARALVRSLDDLSVTHVFGIPGNAILPVFDAIDEETDFHFIATRHEQAAGHAAEGYALATGRVGVCIVTSGPGATNIVTAIADANVDSIPLIVITGQVGADAIGTDAYQEADIVGITFPIVKHSYFVTHAQDVPRVMAEAHNIARSGRPGPVVVDLTMTAQLGLMHYSWPQRMILPGYSPTLKAHGRMLAEAARLVGEASRPVIIAGGGVVRSDAGALVEELAQLTDTPIVTTMPARGVVPDSNPKVLGMLGKYGSIAATGAVQRSDLLIALGTRFSDQTTGALSGFALDAKLVHIDIDPAEIGKNRRPDVPIVGDVATVLKDLIDEIKRCPAVQAHPDRSPWWQQITAWRNTYPTTYEEPNDATLAPQWVIEQLCDSAPPHTLWVCDAGQHQIWAAQFLDLEYPHSWISSNGLGTTGSGLPQAIGAAIGVASAAKDCTGEIRPVWLIVGDGGLEMSAPELATAASEHVPVRIALLNNGVYGMARQLQTLFRQGHHSKTSLTVDDGDAQRPDFVALAGAYGCKALRATTKAQALEAIRVANTTGDTPVLIDFHVSPDAMVWPLVPRGASNDAVLYRQSVTPLAQSSTVNNTVNSTVNKDNNEHNEEQ